jgi:hypothetical protein
MREAATGAAELLRHGGAQEAGRASLRPHLARIEVLLVPLFEMRREFGADKAPRLALEENNVLGHPGRARQIEDLGHGR